MNVALSLGGVIVALALLWANLRPWWKGNRDPRALVPYAAGASIGSLSTICVGGALGWGAAGIAGLISSGADKGIRALTGTGPAPVATASLGTLTEYGGAVTVLLLITVGMMVKTGSKDDRRRIAGGFATFAVLGLLPGVVALLDWWPETINTAGQQLQAFVEARGGLR
ncbi:hypothetical protein [Streptomyces sp. SID3212]|uniref:hypothetical protein n=1 Tax=Streptomyces sp. SID3212 TaxID=2690259 RepID=UPI00136C464D|nr:hypothetical protein [Streptomyces sp. SID3212]MYV53135.1 hypothetical protein [Streptomyces sp. SID3212]